MSFVEEIAVGVLEGADRYDTVDEAALCCCHGQQGTEQDPGDTQGFCIVVRLKRESRYRRSYLKYGHSALRPAAKVGEHVTHNNSPFFKSSACTTFFSHRGY